MILNFDSLPKAIYAMVMCVKIRVYMHVNTIFQEVKVTLTDLMGWFAKQSK